MLGPAYRIDRELGGGGMSRVFVATEVDLDRQVVVKVLPPELAAGVNSERFRREIQLAARLQHPHIVPLLSAGAKGSLLYYTMPFISGENLRSRLDRSGEFPVQEATRLIREVLDALSYAHHQGVVHRDIKPENVLISGNHALVTDFGVSKALSSATSESPAAGHTLTSLGMALGTPAYMAPEQAAADPMVDHRADIYSAGIMAYELLTGSPPFAGLKQQQTLAAQIATAPDPITRRRSQIPPGLASAIMRCLEKRASDRWQSAEEVHAALEPYALTSGVTPPFAPDLQRKHFQWTPQRIAVAAGIVGLVATGLVASTFAFRGNNDTITVGNTRQVTTAPGLEIHPSISRDGRMVAYVTGTRRTGQLFVRQLSGGRAIALTDSTQEPRWPSWRPDGSEILYRSHNKAWLVPALGGSPTRIPELDSLYHCAWSNSGAKLACAEVGSGRLVVVGSKGEDRRYLTALQGETVVAPSWSHDDRLIAFSLGNEDFLGGVDIGNLAPSSVWVVKADGGAASRISDDTHLNTSPVWTPDGAVLFVSSLGGARDIYIQRISGDLSARGKPERLTTGLLPHSISLSRDGSALAYSQFTTVANVWVSTDSGSAAANATAARPVTTGNQTIEQAFVSPDGKWLAYDSNVTGNQDIYLMSLPAGEPRQLTRNEYDDFHPSWSPDGSTIAFHSMKNGNRDLYEMNSDGSNVRPILEAPREQLAPVWVASDVIEFRVPPDSLFQVRRSGDGWGRPTFSFTARGGAFSRDGKRLLRIVGPRAICPDCPPGLYVSAADRSNPQPVQVQEIPGVMADGGAVVWSRDSRFLYGSIRERDGSSSIWQLPLDGAPERRSFHFTDPSRQIYRTTFDLHDGKFYFTLGDRQSDIWVMDLKRR